MRFRAGFVLLLLALLPGLGLAQGPLPRLCLAALVGGSSCCPGDEVRSSCCEPGAAGDLARDAAEEGCTLCCLELPPDAGSRGPVTRGELDAPATAAPVAVPAAPHALPLPIAVERPATLAAPTPPGRARNLPLRT